MNLLVSRTFSALAIAGTISLLSIAIAAAEQASSGTPISVEPTAAERHDLEAYTRRKLDVSRPAFLCDELKSFKDFDPCKSALNGAPPAVPTGANLYGILSLAYEERCPAGICKIEVNSLKILDSFDYGRLKVALETILKSNGQDIAFSGFSAGEIFLVSAAKPTIVEIPRSYYQIRFIARKCDGFLEWSNPCGFYGDASLITISRGIEGKLSTDFRKDVIALRLESKMLDHINEAIGLRTRFGTAVK